MPTQREIDHFLLHLLALANDVDAPLMVRGQAQLSADEFNAANVSPVPPLVFLNQRMNLVVGANKPNADLVSAAIVRENNAGEKHPARLVSELEGRP